MLMMKTLIAMIILWVGSMREAESFMRSSASRLNNFLKKQKNSVACGRVIRIWSRRLNKNVKRHLFTIFASNERKSAISSAAIFLRRF